MDNTLIMVLMIVFAVLGVAGVITALIMKKVKASENAVTVAFLAASFCGLIAAGMLVFMVSVNMMKDYMTIRRYTDYTVENEDKSNSVLIKEYADRESAGFEVYLKDNDKMLADIKTDKYLPFSAGEYEAEWTADAVVISYTHRRTEDSYQAKEITVRLKDGKVSEPKESGKDLSAAPNKKTQNLKERSGES